MLARMIAGHAERGMDAATTAKPLSAAGRPSPAPYDTAWPGGLDLRNLHAGIAGAIACLGGLQHVADGSRVEPEAFEPLLAVLIPWRNRVLAARDALEREADGGEAA